MTSVSHQIEWQRNNLWLFDLPQTEDIIVNNSKHKHNLVNKVKRLGDLNFQIQFIAVHQSSAVLTSYLPTCAAISP